MKGKKRVPFLIQDTLYRNSAYIGAKILSSRFNNNFIEYQISNEEWEESGAKIIDKKTKLILKL